MSPEPTCRLERSCGSSTGDWIRFAPDFPGIARIEARFSGHAYDPHRHDSYAIGCTLDGVQSFDYRGERADSLPGQVMVLHPDEIHNGRAGADGGFRYRMIYIQPHLIHEALGQKAPLPFVPQAVTGGRRLRVAVEAALSDLDAPLEELEADQIIATLAHALHLNDPSTRQPSGGSAARHAVEDVRAYLDANFDRTVRSAELERLSGLDRYRLARHFRACLATSPYRYLTQRRLERARALLNEDLPLAEVAAASGFADQSHMTRQFRRTYGLTPGHWRRLCLSSEPRSSRRG